MEMRKAVAASDAAAAVPLALSPSFDAASERLGMKAAYFLNRCLVVGAGSVKKASQRRRSRRRF
jgi:hypothetical protein